MKLSDYVADFLAKQGIRHVFVVTGGAALHLIDSVARHPDIEYVSPLHEQAAAMAADAYARVTGNMGAAIVTTGPGVTNLMTGVSCLYYDSLPSIFIAGEVSTFRLSKNAPGVRQLGFQEAPHLELMKPITKYATLVEDPTRIRYELEKAMNIARGGRPGPVFVDIPDDVQRMEVNPDGLEPFVPLQEAPKDMAKLGAQIDEALALLAKAKRPVLVLGAAIKIAKVEALAKAFAEKLDIPIGLTWAMMDMFPGDHPGNIGGFGISATRRGNFAVANADLIFSIGSRLDTHATGSPINTFAREAKKIVVDIDSSELAKFPKAGMRIDVPICADVRDFFAVLETKLDAIAVQDISEWRAKILEWRRKYPSCLPEFREQKKYVNPYFFLEVLAQETRAEDIIIPDCGGNLLQTFQGYRVKAGQKVFSAFNNSPMGYSLAASIGACFANDKKSVICIIGDGGLQVNIQELGTVAHHKLPIKIFLFNNHGYGIVQQTQDDWLESRYYATKPETGVPDPDYVKIAEAYGIKAITIRNHDELRERIQETLGSDGPVLCNLEISPNQRLFPMLKYGRPIEDPNPLLPREEFLKEMIVKPLDVSLSLE